MPVRRDCVHPSCSRRTAWPGGQASYAGEERARLARSAIPSQCANATSSGAGRDERGEQRLDLAREQQAATRFGEEDGTQAEWVRASSPRRRSPS